jgi:DNA-binding protein HU-beta
VAVGVSNERPEGTLMPAHEPKDDRESTVTRRTVLRGALATAAVGVLGTTATGTVVAMNKAELIDSIASEADINGANAKKALDAFIDTTTKALKKGNRVGLVGFGSFAVREGTGNEAKHEKKLPQSAAGNSNPPWVVDFTATDELAAALDLVPGEGDTKRVEARNSEKKHEKKHKKKRATWGGPEPDVVIDAKRLVGAADESEDGGDEEGTERLTKADAKKALDAFIDTTTEALKEGDRVALGWFGSFSISKRSARKGRNPQTGKEIKIPAKKVVKFKPGAELSEKIK